MVGYQREEKETDSIVKRNTNHVERFLVVLAVDFRLVRPVFNQFS